MCSSLFTGKRVSNFRTTSICFAELLRSRQRPAIDLDKDKTAGGETQRGDDDDYW